MDFSACKICSNTQDVLNVYAYRKEPKRAAARTICLPVRAAPGNREIDHCKKIIVKVKKRSEYRQAPWERLRVLEQDDKEEATLCS
ncbi:hypothetical protein [[Clostridium] hylemonae]|uniref:hypothetical protein n=1 Tax=[Clostridium] hylemonae TaxID=89153 RepID=UPI001D079E46|nr:hypothetical protein [[Clostridium] hylemonae]